MILFSFFFLCIDSFPSKTLSCLLRSCSQIDSHETSDQSHDHLVLDFDDIFWQGEDDSTLLTGERDGILGVQQVGFLRSVSLNQVHFGGTGTDGINECDDEDTGLERGIVERADLSVGGVLLVGPTNDLSVRNLLSSSESVEDGDDVEAHHLPDQSESQGLVRIHDVISLNVDKREVELLAKFDTIVAIFEFLVCVGWVLVDTLPVDNSRRNLVKEFEEDNTIAKIIVEIVDERINTETVHPVSVGLFFTGFLDDDLDFDRSEGGPSVEEIGDEGKIEFLVTLVDVLGSDELSAIEFLGSLKHHLGSLQEILFLK